MSTWTYIRGWVELTEEMLGEVHRTIEASIGDAVRFGVSEGGAEQCNEGWVIPDEPRIWTYYAFYGRDVRVQSVPFVRHQMELIAQIKVEDEDGYEDHPLGFIHVDEEEESNGPPRVWEIREGRLRERLFGF